MNTRVDVAIAGGGPAGCALALALAQSGRSVALLEAKADVSGDGPLRPLALSEASRMILERVGAWAGLRATTILEVDVSQAIAPGRTRFDADDAGLAALGHVVAYAPLCAEMARLARDRMPGTRFGVQIATIDEGPGSVALSLTNGERIVASCLVHAEGSASSMHEKPYGQSALLAEIEVHPSARHCAWERFTPSGPLALLPFDGRYALVWGLPSARAEALRDADALEFLAELQRAFGDRAGRFAAVRDRWCAPLALRRRARRVEGRQAYIGNAAQTLHPVAGQGLNLGLRDAWALARAMRSSVDAGDPAALARFGRARRLDAEATIRVTDFLATMLDGDNPIAGATRGAAMLALDAFGPARRFFARRMVFGPSAIP